MRQATSSSITPRFLVALLDEHGTPSDDLLTSAGLARDGLASPDLRIAWREFGELWRRAAQHRPDVGLVLHRRFPLGHMHVVTHVAMRSETVGAAFAACGQCYAMLSTIERLSIEAEGDATAIVYRCERSIPEIPWLTEHYFSLIRRLLTHALGRPLPYLAVQLRAPACAPPDAYVEAFGVVPEFNAPRNAIVLHTPTLAWTLPTRDAYLREVLERVVAQSGPLEPAPTQRWADRARTHLINALLQGRAPTMQTTADALAVPVSTLRERLRSEGRTFRTLLDDTRRELAREHLGRGMSASEVAYLLRFSEPAGLQHACRRWFGVAAGAVRQLPPARAGRESGSED